MANNAVVTILIGERHQNIANLTHATQMGYAHKYNNDYVVYRGADYIVYEPNGNSYIIPSSSAVVSKQNFHLSSPSFGSYNKLNLIEIFNRYKRILYIDTDIIIRDDSPNLFDIVPENKLGMLEETKFIDRSSLMFDWSKEFNFNFDNWNKKYYGGGVFLASTEIHKGLLAPPHHFYDDNFYEQTLFNWNIVNNNIEMFDISYKYNRVSYMDGFLMMPRHDSYFIHYAGSWMMLKEGHSQDASYLLKLIKYDLEKWEKSKDYHYEKNARHISRSFWVRD